MNPQPRHFAVIGAGIVGVSTALYLQRDGHRVSLIDHRPPGEGASMGNAAVIAAAACEPVAMPGILWRVPGMLRDPLGPLAIRWGYLPRLAPWLLRFLAASRPARVETISIALRALSLRCREAYEPLIRAAGIADMIRDTGWLCVYLSEASFAEAAAELALQRRRGVKLEVLDRTQIRQLEPSLAPIFERAVFYPENSMTVNNFRLVQRLADDFAGRGGQLLREKVAEISVGPEGPREVATDKARHKVDAVVIAAGAWSRGLARRLGHRVPLDTERGYHIMLPDPGVMPRLPVQIADFGFVATPLEHGLRFAGTVELGGLEAPPDWARARILLERGRRVFPGLKETGLTRWMGFRPSLPDSVPVISGSPRLPHVYFAFGHGHLGLTLGAITGRLIADLAAGRDPGIDMRPYWVDRW
ncbi:MAG TPA: FAD-binding oxidoreductase [Dongiaceae bacterium]|nr:FAD-binding oxidoreductase [Dongiaceae bacterium]